MFAWKNSSWAQVIWTVLRLYLGYSWTTSGLAKVFGSSKAVWVGDKAGTALTGFLNGALAKTSGAHPDVQSWYAWLITQVGLPHAKTISYMVAWSEFLTGVCLLLGFITVIALWVSLFMNFNYLLAGSVSVNPIFIIEALILLWAGWAAYYWGIDRFVFPKWFKRISAG